MKNTLLTLLLIILTTNLYGQSITIDDNGIVKCKGVEIGTTGTIFGDTYEVVDRNLLIKRRDGGVDLTKVCVSNVTDMSEMFRKRQFNQPIGNWDVSSVTNMSGMFWESPFDQPIGNWDVSNVTEMGGMFWESQFNQPIGNWDVSNVTRMDAMFWESPFNQPIGNWDVTKVTHMNAMFIVSQFNQPIGDWNVSNVTKMGDMFWGSPFDQPIGNWDVSNVTDMSAMFYQSQFNQPIGNWDVSKVTDMFEMFRDSPFDQPIANWDVSNVTRMGSMFSGSQFNQPIGDWDVSSVMEMSLMFRDSPFNQPIGNWDLRSVSSGIFMEGMFANTPFNQPLNKWCVTNITLEPVDFSTNSPLTSENKPIWGTCTPNKLTQLTPESNSTDVSIKPQLSWKNDPNSTKYQLQISEGFDPIVVDTLISDTLYVNPISFRGNFTYNWRVRGINDNSLVGAEPMAGEWSEIWSFTTLNEPAGTIILLSPANGLIVDELTPTLTWNTDAKSDYYTVQISGGFTLIEEVVTDTTITSPILSYSTEYQWRVRGTNSSGDGEWSPTWSFTTGAFTSIDTEEVPVQFALKQNYPNPFNPTTQIQFSLPISTSVRLEVFSVLGQRTVTLLNEHIPAGVHTVPFDAGSLSSGVYIYRLTTPEFTQSRLMNLIK